MTHDALLEGAKKAADRLYSDKSVPLDETRQSLTDLREHIDMLLDAVRHSKSEE